MSTKVLVGIAKWDAEEEWKAGGRGSDLEEPRWIVGIWTLQQSRWRKTPSGIAQVNPDGPPTALAGGAQRGGRAVSAWWATEESGLLFFVLAFPVRIQVHHHAGIC